MENDFYLLSYEVEGIKNIDKRIIIDFYNKKLTKNPDFSDYKVKAIFGENGTGKTAIITSIKILKNLMLNKYYLTDSNNVRLLKNLINKKTNNLDLSAEFFCNYDDDKSIVKYSISVNYDEMLNRFVINRETLERKGINSKKPKVIYDIVDGMVSDTCNRDFYDLINEGNGADILRERSFVSTYNFKEIKDGLDTLSTKYTSSEKMFYNALLESILFAASLYVYTDPFNEYDEYVASSALQEYFNSNHKGLPNLDRNAIRESIIIGERFNVEKKDLPNYEEEVKKLYKFISIFKPDLREIEINKQDNRDYYVCDLVFVYDDYKIGYGFESNGIKKLVMLYKALDAVDKGSIVFVDEFDSNIHDVYLCKLIEYIKEYAKGQFCFTSQSITVMDVLGDSKKAIDFISRNGEIVSWVKSGHDVASRKYKNGFIKHSPFNVEPFDFLSVFGDIVNE